MGTWQKKEFARTYFYFHNWVQVGRGPQALKQNVKRESNFKLYSLVVSLCMYILGYYILRCRVTICSISTIWSVYRLTVPVQEVGGNSDQEGLHTNSSVIYCVFIKF